MTPFLFWTYRISASKSTREACLLIAASTFKILLDANNQILDAEPMKSYYNL